MMLLFSKGNAVRTLTIIVFVLAAVVGLSACGKGEAPTYNDTKLEIPTTGEPIIILEKVDPPMGSVLSAGQMLSADIRFSIRPQDYPLDVDVTYWTIRPDYPSWNHYGEGRGCVAREGYDYRFGFQKFEPWQTLHCVFNLHPIIFGWWQEDKVDSVVLEFRARSAGYTGPETVARKQFDIDYRLPWSK